MRRLRLLTMIAAGTFMPLMAWACPFCQGANGVNPVQQEVFGELFWWDLLWMILPFSVCGVVVYWLHTLPLTKHREPQNTQSSGGPSA